MNPYSNQMPQSALPRDQQNPMFTIDTGKNGGGLARNKSKNEKQKETEFPALFCDEGDCTLGQSHTGVACVWNNCVSTLGEELSAEMCEGEECW